MSQLPSRTTPVFASCNPKKFPGCLPLEFEGNTLCELVPVHCRTLSDRTWSAVDLSVERLAWWMHRGAGVDLQRPTTRFIEGSVSTRRILDYLTIFMICHLVRAPLLVSPDKTDRHRLLTKIRPPPACFSVSLTHREPISPHMSTSTTGIPRSITLVLGWTLGEIHRCRGSAPSARRHAVAAAAVATYQPSISSVL